MVKWYIICVLINKSCLKTRGQSSHTSWNTGGVVRDTFNPRTQETEAVDRSLRDQGYPGLHEIDPETDPDGGDSYH